MIPKSETLPCGYRVIPYIYKRKFNFEVSQRDMSLCDNALYLMDKERKKIVEAMKSDDPEESLKEQGFSVYTTESEVNGKKKGKI